MTNAISPLLLAAVIVGVTAFAAGALIAWLIGSARGRSTGEPDLDQDRYRILLTLGRDKRSDKLVVGQNGRVIETSALLSDIERRQMVEAHTAWQEWLGVTPPPPVTSQPDPNTYYYPKAETYVPALVIPPVETAPKGTMIEQIDHILQEMLPTSAAAGQVVRIAEEPGMGVVVWVGARRFEGVDAVPDPLIQQVLHNAVNEWERRQPI